MTQFTMDGRTYNIDITSYRPSGEWLDKYGNRSEQTGSLKYETIGYFENLEITFKGDNNQDFADLYEDLKTVQPDGTRNHDVEMITPLGTYTRLMYPGPLEMPLIRLRPGTNNFWGEMTVKFIAVDRS